jgi:enterochelin esterase-like enzyme
MSCGTSNLSPTPEARELFSATDLSLRLRKHAFSSHFGPDRDLIVYVPPAYDENVEARFPVLYLQDGQNLFDGTTSYVPGMHWRVHETADGLIAKRCVQPLIIVGIGHAGEKRVNEYTPTSDGRRRGGSADSYGRMLADEIKPFIDSNYRTISDPSNTAVGGSSLGGLVTLYLGFLYPNVFGKLASLSPSVWWNERSILNFVKDTVPKPRLKIWLDVGTGEDPRVVRDVQLLRETLVTRGWKLGDDLHYSEVEGAVHNEAAWAERVGPFLEYLFPATSRVL